MNEHLNMAEATLKMRLDAPEYIGQLLANKKLRGVTLTFEHDGRKYDLTLSRSKT